MNNQLSPEQQIKLEQLSQKPFGRELAGKVARFLKENGSIAYNHRDYCGTGLFYLNHQYLHTAVDDGNPVVYFAEERGWVFSDPHKFIDWLAMQSDHSLSMHDNPNIFSNQTITRHRLLAALNRSD
ncbi:MAG TPA: hypothetical protein DEA96_18645 [Leptospiraceae bacterium]|nr:hypothetical protein [Spirochaetaceae bacterium]HBS06997.1 hypothetical protein [Leptospiraceae bacterium]